MIETKDFIGNVKTHGSKIQDIISSLRATAMEGGIEPDNEAILKLKELWEDIQSNTRLMLSRVNVPVGPGIPKSFLEVAESCTEITNWKVETSVGSGNTGATYAACKAGNCNYVIKRQPTAAGEEKLRADKSKNYEEHYSFRSELKALMALQGWKHAPKLYAAWTCEDVGYMVMEKLDVCKEGVKTYEKVKKMVDELYNTGWVHMDAHPQNILCRSDGELVLIDYGRARSFTDPKDPSFAHPHPWTMGSVKLTPEDAYVIEVNYLKSDFGITETPYGYDPGGSDFDRIIESI